MGPMRVPADGQNLAHGAGSQHWPSTTSRPVQAGRLIKGGAQVGGRRHKQKEKVAQTGWDVVFGESTGRALLPPLHYSLDGMLLGHPVPRQHSSSLPSPPAHTQPSVAPGQTSTRGSSKPLAGAIPRPGWNRKPGLAA